MEISFTVRGLAAPQGSKNARAVYRKNADGARVPTGQINQVESSKRLKPWRTNVHDMAEAAVERWCNQNTSVAASLELRHMFEGPVVASLLFYFERPKTHFGTGYNSERLKPSAPPHPSTKSHLNGGDIDKLARGVLDAMTGVVYKDDSQVVGLWVVKAYGYGAGVRVTVKPASSLIVVPA